VRFPRYIKLDETLSKFWRKVAFEEGISTQKICTYVLYYAMEHWDSIQIDVDELEEKYPQLRNQKPGRKPRKQQEVKNEES